MLLHRGETNVPLLYLQNEYEEDFPVYITS